MNWNDETLKFPESVVNAVEHSSLNIDIDEISRSRPFIDDGKTYHLVSKDGRFCQTLLKQFEVLMVLL